MTQHVLVDFRFGSIYRTHMLITKVPVIQRQDNQPDVGLDLKVKNSHVCMSSTVYYSPVYGRVQL